MKALDPISFEQQMVDYIDKLIEVDNYRQNYYKDLSKQDRVNDHSIFNRMKIADIKQFAVAFLMLASFMNSDFFSNLNNRDSQCNDYC